MSSPLPVRPNAPRGLRRPLPVARPKADALLYVTLLLAWVDIWRIQDVIAILGKIKFAVIVEAAALLVFALDTSPQRRLKWIKSPIVMMIAGIFFLMVTSLPTSLWAGKGVNFMVFDFMPTAVLMVIMATSARERSDLEWLALGHLIGGGIYTVYVYKYCPVGSGGRLGNLVFYDANDFALVMVCSIPFAVYFMRPGVSLVKRLFALFSVAMFVLMIIRSGSRGGFLGLITVGAYILLRYRSIPARMRIGAVVAGVAVFLVFGTAAYWNMMGTMLHPNDDYNMKEETGRKAVWKRGLVYMVTHPLTGVGIRAFPQAEGKISPIAIEYAERGKGIKWSVAHNSFIEIGAECGVIAFVLFPALLFVTFRTLSRVRAGPPGTTVVTPVDAAFAQALFASLIGFAVCGFFVSAEYFPYLYLLLGLTVGQQAILKRRALAGRPREPHPVPQPRAAARPVQRPRVRWLPAGA